MKEINSSALPRKQFEVVRVVTLSWNRGRRQEEDDEEEEVSPQVSHVGHSWPDAGIFMTDSWDWPSHTRLVKECVASVGKLRVTSHLPHIC